MLKLSRILAALLVLFTFNTHSQINDDYKIPKKSLVDLIDVDLALSLIHI